MTAFSRAEKTENEFSILTEIRSYNSRYLDITLRLPHAYLSLEERIKELISARVTRGRIDVTVQIRDESDEACTFEINMAKAGAYHESLVQLKNTLNIGTEISLELLMGAGGIIRPAEPERDMENNWPEIQECLTAAINELDSMKTKEGNFIAQDFIERLDYIEKCLTQITNESVNLSSFYQQRLKERISILTQDLIEIDPIRIAQEAAFLADRSDISEEITRVLSHIKQFRDIMDSNEPAGRKLNFLLQEFNREFNTMGSKASNADVSHLIVDVKSEIEKIREQVQNVE